MTHLIIAVIGVWGCFLCWKFFLRPAILDSCRDSLFDLRDGCRQWFLDKGFGLNLPEYAAIRQLINQHIYTTEHMRFAQYLYFVFSAGKHDETMDRLLAQEERYLASENREIRKYIEHVRKEAGMVLLTYVAMCSTWAFALMLLALAATMGCGL